MKKRWVAVMAVLMCTMVAKSTFADPGDEFVGQVRGALLDEAKIKALEKFAEAVATRVPKLASGLRAVASVSKATGPILDLLESTPLNDVRGQAATGIAKLSNEILMTQKVLEQIQVDYQKHQRGEVPRHGADWYALILKDYQSHIKQKAEAAKLGCDSVKIEEPTTYKSKFEKSCIQSMAAAHALIAIDSALLQNILPKRSPND